VVSGDDEHKVGRARISTLSEEQMKKLAGNTERKGTILDLSDGEISKLAGFIESRLTQMWREQGFL
jgi:cytochrome c553